MQTIIEWGLQTNCSKNGCDPPHSDDGRVYPCTKASFDPRTYEPEEAWPINSHATSIVKRTVIYGEWERV